MRGLMIFIVAGFVCLGISVGFGGCGSSDNSSENGSDSAWGAPCPDGWVTPPADWLDLKPPRCQCCNLFKKDLSRKYLEQADLIRANLTCANLYRANLYRANLYRANLFYADLHAADLYAANLSAAKLYRANLTGADLSGAMWTDGRVCAQGSIGRCN